MRYLTVAGKPSFLLGVNYWSRAGGPRMWDRFDESVVERELGQMRSIGLNVCRSFAFIPSFMPRPPALSRKALARFGRFLELCAKVELATIPSFLCGHMSGENHDFPGQRGRSPYTSRTILQWERRLVQGIAAVTSRHDAVCAYLASNEMPLWGGPSDPATIHAWARAIRSALRSKDASRPFSLGDGVMNLSGGQNGFDPVALSDLVDFVGPHAYYADTDPFRQALYGEYCIRSLSHLGLPVLFEEFGCSASQASEEGQALYYRELCHGCLSAGAAGALGWCFSDLALEDEPPYRHHAFELEFGITRADGSEKPVCDELRALSSLCAGLDFARLEPPRPRAAILVPSYFNTSYPFSEDDRRGMGRTLLQSYALCVGAGIEAELCPEGSDLTPYSLVLCPATQKLLAPSWRALLTHARAGATVYWSYFGGSSEFLQGAWCNRFRELTGCRHGRRYGCYDLPDDELSIEGSGLLLKIRTDVGPLHSRAFLPIEPEGATEIAARDGRGRPALTRNPIGRGEIWFLYHPLERTLAEQRLGADDGMPFALYRLLAARAGIAPQVTTSDPGVQLRVVADGPDRPPLLWAINHRFDPVATTVDSPGGVPIHGTDLRLGEGRATLALGGKGVAVYRLARAP